jgi:hypothetical protein
MMVGMKIEEMGYVITNVPGVEKIIVEPDEDAPSGVHIMVHMTNTTTDFTIEDFAKFAYAMQYVVDLTRARFPTDKPIDGAASE